MTYEQAHWLAVNGKPVFGSRQWIRIRNLLAHADELIAIYARKIEEVALMDRKAVLDELETWAAWKNSEADLENEMRASRVAQGMRLLCSCRWSASCHGTGLLVCEGCLPSGTCLCACGGEKPCRGCLECPADEPGPFLRESEGE